jgi:glycerol uptake facilitator-like aquaporin
MDGSGKTPKQLLAIGVLEALGTAILVIAINYSAGNAVVVLNGVLTAAVLSGRLTGAHLNMAVSVGIFLADESKKMKKNIIMLLVMLLSQFIGAFLG